MQIVSYLKRLWSWLRGIKATEPPVLTLVPQFDFTPTTAFRSFVGNDARFVISNMVDLIMQHQGLMSEMLVVEVHTAYDTSTLWMRYSAEELALRGAAKCTLFVGCCDQSFEGVCGQLRNRKRM